MVLLSAQNDIIQKGVNFVPTYNVIDKLKKKTVDKTKKDT